MTTAAATAPNLLDDPKFQHAVETARQHIPIHKHLTRDDAWTPFVIVRKDSGRLAVYNARSWEQPTQQPMLPWSPPTGTPVATVNLDGTVTLH